ECVPGCRRQVPADRAPVGVRVGPVDGGHGPAVQLTACESFESISDREGEFAVLRGLLGLHGVLVAEVGESVEYAVAQLGLRRLGVGGGQYAVAGLGPVRERGQAALVGLVDQLEDVAAVVDQG